MEFALVCNQLSILSRGTVGHAPYLMHGKVSPINHSGEGIFKDIPSPYNATRYHSLCAVGELPVCLEVTAKTEDGIVMAVQHKKELIGVRSSISP